MKQYIDKAAVVAEIKRCEKICENYIALHKDTVSQGIANAKRRVCQQIIEFINTLEVKEADLNKEIELVKGDYEQVDVAWNNDFDYIARHFFELGLKAKIDKELVEEIYSHIDGIKDTADRMTSGNFMHHRAAIKFSANVIGQVLGLIGLKRQKGE